MRAALGCAHAALEHIGSTSVAGLAARPVIDLLLGLAAPLGRRETAALAAIGYSRERSRRSGRTYLRKGTPRSHCLHVAPQGSAEWRDALAFRDHLRADPAAAARYSELKRASGAASDPGAYARAKARFIVAALADANVKGRLGGGPSGSC